MGIIWMIIIGCIAGVIAKFIMPGDKEPSGFIMTTVLGIVGAFVASYLGRSLGWYSPGEGAGLRRDRRGDHRPVRIWPHHRPANDLNGEFKSDVCAVTSLLPNADQRAEPLILHAALNRG